MRSVFTEKDLDILKKKHKDKIEAKKKLRTEIGPTKAPVPVEKETETDSDLSAVTKFIPGLSVAIFTSVLPLLKGALDTTPVEFISYGLFIFCLLLSIFITYNGASKEKITIEGLEFEIPGKYVKTIITAVAFVIWAFNIEAFISNIENYDPVIGNTLLLLFTMAAPYIYKYLPENVK